MDSPLQYSCIIALASVPFPFPTPIQITVCLLKQLQDSAPLFVQAVGALLRCLFKQWGLCCLFKQWGLCSAVCSSSGGSAPQFVLAVGALLCFPHLSILEFLSLLIFLNVPLSFPRSSFAWFFLPSSKSRPRSGSDHIPCDSLLSYFLFRSVLDPVASLRRFGNSSLDQH